MVNEHGETVCDTCGVRLGVGDYPFCPHGTGASSIERDEIPGGLTVENYGPEPITFYSHSERRKYMQAHGLQEKERFCPRPGTDIDPAGIPNPSGYMDAQTLANAAALISRNGQAEEWDGEKAGVIRFTTGTMSTEEAIRAQVESRK